VEAIKRVGGFNIPRGDPSNVLVVRQKNGKQTGCVLNLKKVMEGQEEPSFFLQPHDVIYVPPTTIAKVNNWVEQYISRNLPQISARPTRFHTGRSKGNGPFPETEMGDSARQKFPRRLGDLLRHFSPEAKAFFRAVAHYCSGNFSSPKIYQSEAKLMVCCRESVSLTHGGWADDQPQPVPGNEIRSELEIINSRFRREVVDAIGIRHF
jgi:hypothetical protein